jgi:predicted dehydrogenase
VVGVEPDSLFIFFPTKKRKLLSPNKINYQYFGKIDKKKYICRKQFGMVKIGVLGAGFLGRIHINLLKKIADFELVGFYDPDKKNTEKAISEYNVKSFESIDSLLDAVDAIDIVTPTVSHYDCAVKALKMSKHIFIEKPITNTLDEAASLLKLTKEAGIIVQVGHVERFNPAFIAAKPYLKNPMFIESHRLAQFNPRGTDVPVVLDLMIHDIDIVLSLVKSNIKRISANGLAVLSNTPDIASARIEFTNGCVANLTASRISMNNMRRSRLFQKDAFISLDFLNKKTEVFMIKKKNGNKTNTFHMNIDLGNDKGEKIIYIEKPKIIENNAIEDELIGFYSAIKNKTTPLVSIDDGYSALNIAHSILDKVKSFEDLKI